MKQRVSVIQALMRLEASFDCQSRWPVIEAHFPLKRNRAVFKRWFLGRYCEAYSPEAVYWREWPSGIGAAGCEFGFYAQS